MFKATYALLGGAIIAGSVATTIDPPAPRLVWNASASAPIGLWRIAPDAPVRRGDMVAARFAEPWRSFAARRRYLPSNIPLIKRVAAVAGDRVCSTMDAITVNGTTVAVRLKRDGAGRAMPEWSGCTTLRQGSLFLLMDAPASFDGRYFGLTERRDIIGRATPLWLR